MFNNAAILNVRKTKYSSHDMDGEKNYSLSSSMHIRYLR